MSIQFRNVPEKAQGRNVAILGSQCCRRVPVCVGVCEQEVIRPLNLLSIRVDTGVILYRLTPLDASIQIWFVPRSAPITPTHPTLIPLTPPSIFGGLAVASQNDISSAFKQHFSAAGYL